MKDPASYAKAKADWASVQEVAARRFHFDRTRSAYIQTQSARITRTIDLMERLEWLDGMCDVPAGQCDSPGIGYWPYT